MTNPHFDAMHLQCCRQMIGDTFFFETVRCFFLGELDGALLSCSVDSYHFGQCLESC